VTPPLEEGLRMKLRIIAVVTAVLMMFVFSSCLLAADKVERNWPESVDKYVANAKKSVKTIDMLSFKKIAANKGDAVLLDVREPDEFKAGHVPASVNVPRGLVEFRIWKTFLGYPAKTDFNKKIYVYCALGGRAILATKTLKDLGFTDVTAVDMKIADWIKAGNPVER
jgi:rhodanese-related sulfurtransferase